MKLKLSIFASLTLVMLSCQLKATSEGENWPEEKSRRWLLEKDFDGDGQVDVLLSQPVAGFGNAGGGFKLYLRKKNEFSEAGMIFAHPKAIAIEQYWKQTRIWTYQRGGGWVGMLGYYELVDGKLSEFKGIEVNPGDGGTDLSNSLVSVIFESSNAASPKLVTSSGDIAALLKNHNQSGDDNSE